MFFFQWNLKCLSLQALLYYFCPLIIYIRSCNETFHSKTGKSLETAVLHNIIIMTFDKLHLYHLITFLTSYLSTAKPTA